MNNGTHDGPLASPTKDGFGHAIAERRLSSAIADGREFILITRTPMGGVTYVAVTADTDALWSEATLFRERVRQIKLDETRKT